MRPQHWLYTIPLRLRSLFRRRRVECELDEELQFHLGRKIEEGIANGLSPKEARYAAMRAMDGLEQRKEEMRDMRCIHWLTDFLDDARFAIRSVSRTPGLTAFVVITLALGIGMTSGTFSMVDALIFKPYPVPHPSGVVTLVSTTHDSSFDNFSYREYLDIRGKTKSYDGVIANADMEAVGFSAEPAATPRIKGGMMVSGNYFHVLGVEPRLGRGFREDEDQVPGRDAVVVLGPDARIRERPLRPRQDDSLEWRRIHRDWRRTRNLPGAANIRASRLLHAPGHGACVFDQPPEEFFRGPRRSRVGRQGALETGHDARRGAE
jgi:putative ABC transport system permease protein